MRHLKELTLSAIIMAACILYGCASVPIASPEYERMARSFSPPPEMASVYIYRPYNFMLSALMANVTIDDKRLGSVAPGTYLFGNVVPGNHIIKVKATKPLSRAGVVSDDLARLDAEPGKLYFFKIVPAFVGRLKIKQVDEDVRNEISGCNLSGDSIFDPASIARPSLTEKHVQKPIERIPCKTIELPIAEGSGISKIEVRLAKESEISKVWPNTLFEGFMEGGASLFTGIGCVIMNPMLGQAAAVGGIILFPGLTVMGAINASDRSAIVTAFKEVDLPKRLQETIDRRLHSDPVLKPERTYLLEIVILGYGLLSETKDDRRSSGLHPKTPPEGVEILCFNFDAEVNLKDSNGIVYQDRITLERYRRSIDAPPPTCTSLNQFAAADAKLTKKTLEEASEVIAAIVVKRLRGTQ
jgi:hypothetical protein